MQPRNFMLPLTGALVVVALGVLLVRVGAQPAMQPDADALARAQAEFQRRQQAPAPATTPAFESSPKARVVASASDERDDATAPSIAAEAPAIALPPTIERGEPVASADLTTAMDETNALYDRRDYEGAMEAALELLEREPQNSRMLRVVVSSACMMGEIEVAKAHNERLPERDQMQMRRRCERYGFEL